MFLSLFCYWNSDYIYYQAIHCVGSSHPGLFRLFRIEFDWIDFPARESDISN